MSQGCEVIHLGHNRSVQEVVDAALEEDVQGVAVSSYQGGHVEYFEYLVESLRAARRGPRQGGRRWRRRHRAEEIERLRDSGVTIFSPEDGQRMGLVGMINSVVADCDVDLWADRQVTADAGALRRPVRRRPRDHRRRGRRASTSRCSTTYAARPRAASRARCSASPAPAARASRRLTDELVRRFRIDQQDKLRIAVIAVDPTRRKGGGALLGDRIRMNSLDGDRVFFRCAGHPRRARGARAPRRRDRRAQGGRLRPRHRRDPRHRAGRRGASCRSSTTRLYVMTPEFGAASQLEKIDMLDFADVVAINKFERRGAKDALRDVGRQLVRNREAFGKQPRRHAGLRHQRRDVQRRRRHRALPAPARRCSPTHGLAGRPTARSPTSTSATPPASARSCPPTGSATSPRSPRPSAATTRAPSELAEAARRVQRARARSPTSWPTATRGGVAALLEQARKAAARTRSPTQLERWPAVVESYSGDEQVVVVRDKRDHTPS